MLGNMLLVFNLDLLYIYFTLGRLRFIEDSGFYNRLS